MSVEASPALRIPGAQSPWTTGGVRDLESLRRRAANSSREYPKLGGWTVQEWVAARVGVRQSGVMAAARDPAETAAVTLRLVRGSEMISETFEDELGVVGRFWAWLEPSTRSREHAASVRRVHQAVGAERKFDLGARCRRPLLAGNAASSPALDGCGATASDRIRGDRPGGHDFPKRWLSGIRRAVCVRTSGHRGQE